MVNKEKRQHKMDDKFMFCNVQMVVGGKKERETCWLALRDASMGMSGDHPTDTNKMKQVPNLIGQCKPQTQHSSLGSTSGNTAPGAKIQRICLLAMCGIHQGLFRYLSTDRFLVKPYFKVSIFLCSRDNGRHGSR